MRQYYASDKKRREEAKRKRQAEKRLTKLNKSQNKAQAKSEDATTPVTPGEEGVPSPELKP